MSPACQPGAAATEPSNIGAARGGSHEPSGQVRSDASADAGRGILLRRKFAPGQTNFYVMEREETARMIMMMLRVPAMRRAMTDVWIERVRSVEPGGAATVEWVLDRAQYQRPSDRGDYRFDSVSDQPNQESRPIASVVNHPITVRQAPAGSAQASAGAPLPPATTHLNVTSAPASAPTQPPQPPPSPLPQYDIEELKGLLARTTTAFLPANRVSPGDAWIVTYTEVKNLLGTLVHRWRCSLKELASSGGHTIAVITVEGDCSLARPDTPPKANSELKIKTSRWSGEIRFDVDRGRIVTVSLRNESDVVSENTLKDGTPLELESLDDRSIKLRAVDQLPPKPIVVGPAPSHPAGQPPPAHPANQTATGSPPPTSTQPLQPAPRFRPPSTQPRRVPPARP